MADPQRALERVRAICLALPEATERLSHGAPTFFVRGKKTFVTLHDDHHGDNRLALWCHAPPGAQDEMIEADPDWDEIAEICVDGYRQVAPTPPRSVSDTQRRIGWVRVLFALGV